MFVVLRYWVLVTSYVAKANWYTFNPCYLLHLNLSPSSTFGKKTTFPELGYVNLRTHSARNISLFCAPEMTVGSRKDTAWAWQFSEKTSSLSVMSNTW